MSSAHNVKHHVLDEWLPLNLLNPEIMNDALDAPGVAEPPSTWVSNNAKIMNDYVKLINHVVSSGKHNYEGLKIPINSSWNLELLRMLLIDYHDKEIVQFLAYGFPVDRTDVTPLEMSGRNHKGATLFQAQIDQYIAKEVHCGATIGPFEAIPFKGQVAVSPLSSRPKKDLKTRRVIMDCSWPMGRSLNDGIAKNTYLGKDITLKYPTVDTLARRVYV